MSGLGKTNGGELKWEKDIDGSWFVSAEPEFLSAAASDKAWVSHQDFCPVKVLPYN